VVNTAGKFICTRLYCLWHPQLRRTLIRSEQRSTVDRKTNSTRVRRNKSQIKITAAGLQKIITYIAILSYCGNQFSSTALHKSFSDL
jgi:hypothetical protein